MITEQVALSLVGFAQAATLGVIGIVGLYVRHRFSKIEKPLAEVKHNVVNDHDTNMREESDARHDENSGLLRSIRLSQVNGEARQLEQGQMLDALLDLGIENRQRIIALEATEATHDHATEVPQSRSERRRTAYSPPYPQSRRDRRYRDSASGVRSGPHGDHP